MTDFHVAIERAAFERESGGIGTLGEKTLHATLKIFVEPSSEYHEKKIGDYYADIERDGHIIEIQTRAFDRLRKKLAFFLDNGYSVTVVYPVPAVKWISWIDREQGEVGEKRRSPKKGTVYDIVSELYKIRPLISNDRLDFRVLLLEVVDYRNLDGYGKSKKIRSTRFERMPLALLCEATLGMNDRFSVLLPSDLPESFTSADLAAAASISRSIAQKTLLLLTDVGVVTRIGKEGRCFIYKTNH